MNKNVSPKIVTGAKGTNAAGVGPVSQIGMQVVKTKAAEPMFRTKGASPLGNEIATNVGKGAPGAGRNVHQCGSQGRHGGSDGNE